MLDELDTGQIKTWRSIVTLIVFILTSFPLLFPFHIPFYNPSMLCDALITLRLMPAIPGYPQSASNQGKTMFIRKTLPINFITALLMSTVFLIAISAIGRSEVQGGVMGNDEMNFSPYDVVLVFLCLGYIGNSIEASGLIRYLVAKMFHFSDAKLGHRLFFYLYLCFFLVGIFLGNDPIMVLFLSYMVQVTRNIKHPRAWIHMQFAIANVATGVFVSSNPTNLVIAGAFSIKYISFTANMIVPVATTALLLFPYMLYIVFADRSLIPAEVEAHEISEESRRRKPVPVGSTNIANVEFEDELDDEEVQFTRRREAILNPFLDKWSAILGSSVMVITVVLLLALNAKYLDSGGNTDYYITLPATFVVMAWDFIKGWLNLRSHRRPMNEAEASQAAELEGEQNERSAVEPTTQPASKSDNIMVDQGNGQVRNHTNDQSTSGPNCAARTNPDSSLVIALPTEPLPTKDVQQSGPDITTPEEPIVPVDRQKKPPVCTSSDKLPPVPASPDHHGAELTVTENIKTRQTNKRATLFRKLYDWFYDKFPTMAIALQNLPYPLIPFAFCMFILVEGLVGQGWIPVFAHGWNHWATKTGTVGCVASMGFLATILFNFAGTNIGASILLSRVIHAWQAINFRNDTPVSDKVFWATVYSMAIGVNFGAFSLTFSASLTGIMWRTVLGNQQVRVGGLEFVRVNLPIIVFAMIVACSILVGEVYLVRSDAPHYG